MVGILSLLPLLLCAVCFYFMMRLGCGAHMVHGRGGHGGQTPEENTKDPVCGMDVAPGAGYTKMHKSGQYRFCSRKCLDQFDAEPQRYLASTGGM